MAAVTRRRLPQTYDAGEENRGREKENEVNLAVGTIAKPDTGRGLRLGLLAAALTLTAAVAIGLVAWQATTGDTAKPLPGADARALPAHSEPAPVFYIVRDEEQAARVQATEDEAAWIRYQGGDVQPVGSVGVVVADKQLPLALMLLEISTANEIRVLEGLAPMPVIDLR